MATGAAEVLMPQQVMRHAPGTHAPGDRGLKRREVVTAHAVVVVGAPHEHVPHHPNMVGMEGVRAVVSSVPAQKESMSRRNTRDERLARVW
jgi:hypothetical protein